MTGQTLLDTCELLNQELQLQTSEADVVRGLTALNCAQDYFESLAAQEGKILGDLTTTVASVADTETTAFPTGWLRIDRIQWIDPSTSRPGFDLEPANFTGGHVRQFEWPISVLLSTTPGVPDTYWTNGRLIYWSPLPDTAHTFRVYGFAHASDITASGTFAYDDELRLPFASFATQLLKYGVDDDASALGALADKCFSNAIKGMVGVVRDGASAFKYTQRHTT